MNKALKGILKWLISIVIIFITYWFTLPPINIRSREFWTFVIFSIIVCVAINAFAQIFSFIKANFTHKIQVNTKMRLDLSALGKPIKFAFIVIAALVVIGALSSIVGAELFNAKAYKNLITVSDGDFTQDVAEISMEQIPIVDRDTASRLAQRKLGEMSDLVSQFEIEDIYTQINYKGKPVRVTPLIYGDIIKWLNNQKKGIPGNHPCKT